MAGQLRINADAEAMIRPELFDGETILWAGRPSALLVAANFLFTARFGLTMFVWLSLLVLFFLHDPRQSLCAREIAIIVLFPVVMVVLPLFGLSRIIAKTGYGVTDQRTFWVQPAQTIWLRGIPISMRDQGVPHGYFMALRGQRAVYDLILAAQRKLVAGSGSDLI